MSGDSRRDFLKKLAKGAVYSTPAVVAMSAPRALAGQGTASQHHTGGGGHGMTAAAPGAVIGPPPPGAVPSPGSAPTN